MKTCPYCNAQIEDDAAVCSFCGQFQYDNTQEEAPAAQAVAFDTAAAAGEQPAFDAQQTNSFTSGAQQAYQQTNQQAYQQYQQPNYQQSYQQEPYRSGPQLSNSSKTASILSYFTWIGFLIGYFIGDKKDPFTRFHLNQALVLNIGFTIINIVSNWFSIFSLLGLVLFVFAVLAIVKCAKGEMYKVPILGDIQLIKENMF